MQTKYLQRDFNLINFNLLYKLLIVCTCISLSIVKSIKEEDKEEKAKKNAKLKQ